MQGDMIGLTDDELMVCHLIAQAIPLNAHHDSCQCRNEDTCGYCRFIAAGVVDHLADSGYRIARLIREPCPWCNDEGVVHSHDGEVIGPCDCAPEEPS